MLRLIFVSLFLSNVLFAQVYIPVRFDTNHVWIQNVNANGGGSNCSHTVQMKVTRSKYFNSQLYLFVSKFGAVQSSGNTNDCVLNTKSSGFVRQDSIQRKIWLYDSIQNTERLLYDFNQSPGDTAKHVYWFSPAQCAIVSGTNTVLLQDGLNHKVITYSVANVMSMAFSSAIEGVGYSAGFFDPWYQVQNPLYKNLDCYGKIVNGNQNLQSIYGNNCNLLSSVQEKYEGDFRVFPNPAESWLGIESKVALQIQIKNKLGLTVLEKNLDGNATEILIDGLPAGIYYLHFSGNKHGVVKLVKR